MPDNRPYWVKPDPKKPQPEAGNNFAWVLFLIGCIILMIFAVVTGIGAGSGLG